MDRRIIEDLAEKAEEVVRILNTRDRCFGSTLQEAVLFLIREIRDGGTERGWGYALYTNIYTNIQLKKLHQALGEYINSLEVYNENTGELITTGEFKL